MYCLIWVMFFGVVVQDSLQLQNSEDNIIKNVVKECIVSRNRISCFANKAAKALERSMDWNVRFFDGVTFTRNKIQVLPETEARARSYGFKRLVKALNNFLNGHTFTVDLTEEEQEAEARGGGDGDGGWGGGGGGGFGGYGNAIKKEKKYMQYAFMVLLGIFGLTGPLVMKTLAVMAAKALLASKTALIIVGSVALKKIFEKDHQESSVKVHTITTEDHHDRIFVANTPLPYWSYEPYVQYT